MSPSGGLRGRRGSILGTAVQLGRRGYDSVHFFGAFHTFFGSWTAQLEVLVCGKGVVQQLHGG